MVPEIEKSGLQSLAQGLDRVIRSLIFPGNKAIDHDKCDTWKALEGLNIISKETFLIRFVILEMWHVKHCKSWWYQHLSNTLWRNSSRTKHPIVMVLFCFRSFLLNFARFFKLYSPILKWGYFKFDQIWIKRSYPFRWLTTETKGKSDKMEPNV